MSKQQKSDHGDQQGDSDSSDDSLLDLLQSCANITSASLSCPSYAVNADMTPILHKSLTTGVIACNYETEAIREELNISRWLNGQIDEYRAALLRKKYQQELRYSGEDHTTSARKESSDKPNFKRDLDVSLQNSTALHEEYPVKRIKEHTEQQLREHLFDVTLQKDRENILLTRIQMSTACMFTTFPQYAASICHQQPPLITPGNTMVPLKKYIDGVSDTAQCQNVVQDDHGFHLRKQALIARDFVVLATLDTAAQVDTTRKSIHDLVQKMSLAQQENRILWNQLLQQRGSEEENGRIHVSESIPRGHLDTKGDKTTSNPKEIVLLENILTHLICGSGIDWYNNVRLRQTLERIQTEGRT